MKNSFKYVICFTIMLCVVSGPTLAHAATTTFPAGSYIIPQDNCWQPNNDPEMMAQPAGCDPNKNDQGMFQAIGLIYDILQAGYPVYWIINPGKTTPEGVDVSITKAGSLPVVTIQNSSLANSGAATTVQYIGGPFVLDGNTVDANMLALFKKYPNVKIHQSNYDFSAQVNEVLSGTPPTVAVLGEGSTQILTNYLFASGLANELYTIFDYVSDDDIAGAPYSTTHPNGILGDYQLLWAPHWQIDLDGISVAEEHAVINNIYNFITGGNAGFFECASIQTLERSYDLGGTTCPGTTAHGNLADVCPNEDLTGPVASNYLTGEGLLTSPTLSGKYGRIEENGGNLPTSGRSEQTYLNNLVYEHVTDPLSQCGGWNYVPVTGLTENVRASQQYTPSYTFNTTIERYIHDPDNETLTGYAPLGFNYYMGGRINGSPTQGFVAYLGGHQYAACTNSTTATPVERSFEFDFNTPGLVSTTTVTVEAVYSGCTAGSTCPKANFNLTSMSGTYGTDGTLFVDLDSAQYGPVYESDGVTVNYYALTNVIVGNSSPSAGNTITAINVTYNKNPTTTILTNMWDTSDEVSPPDTNVCSPNEPSTASCNPLSLKDFQFNFNASLASGDTVTVEAQYGSCTTGAIGNCPKASYVIGQSAGTIGHDSNIKVDMSEAAFASNSLTGVAISNLSTSQTYTLNYFNVYFPGNGTTELTTVKNVTSSPTTVCTSDSQSTAACPPQVVTPIVSTNQFYFSNSIASGTFTVEADYTGCSHGSTCPSASYTIGGSGHKTTSSSGVTVDLTSALFHTVSGKYILDDVKISATASTTITDFYVTFPGGGKMTYVYDNATQIWSGGWSGQSSVAHANSFSPSETLTQNPAPILGISLATAPLPLDLVLGQAVTQCTINWALTNTCGMKYVLNTLLGLQFQLIPYEYDKAGDISNNNILYRADFEYPGYKGHVYSINMQDDPAVQNWDAGKSTTMPVAGSQDPPSPSNDNVTRYIFTNLTGTTIVNFDITNVGATQTDTTKLWHYLDPAAAMTLPQVEALINSVRGRNNASSTNISGTGEMTKRLGGIEHSTPALMVDSPLVTAANEGVPVNINGSKNGCRDQILFVGADDGMLHAFYAGSGTLLTGGTCTYNTGTGAEIWAYIPSGLLSSIQNETFTNCSPGGTTPCPVFTVAVSVDGSPALGDFFVSPDGNPTTPKQWRTIVTGTAKIMVPGSTSQVVDQGIVFALDVSNPYNPQVLWERSYQNLISASTNTALLNYYPTGGFPASYITTDTTQTFDPNMGNAQSTSIGQVQVGTTLNTYVFLTSQWIRQVNIGTTSSPQPVWGLSVFALNFFNGNLEWETKILYDGNAEGVNDTPPLPALMDYGNNGTDNYVIFGDLEGRLWILNALTGKSVVSGGGPAFTVGAGANEPIGVPVAIYDHDIVFGTGGRDSLYDESTYTYHLFAVSIDNLGNITDLWNPAFALNPGEKVWSTPVIDANGYVYVGTASGFTDVGAPNTVVSTSTGRFLVLSLATGQLAKTSSGATINPISLSSAVLGNIAVENNHVTLQLFNGQVIQVGSSSSTSFTSNITPTNPVKTLWWRKL